MADTTKQAWEQFQGDMKALAGELRRNYEGADDQQRAAEINRSVRELGKAAEAFFESLGTTTRDPEVRASTKRAAQSFGSALTETFREVGGELEKAFRQPAPPK
jgi:hypothetical protein